MGEKKKIYVITKCSQCPEFEITERFSVTQKQFVCETMRCKKFKIDIEDKEKIHDYCKLLDAKDEE